MYSKYLEHLYAYMRRLFNTKNDIKIPPHVKKKKHICILSEHLVDIFNKIYIDTSLG